MREKKLAIEITAFIALLLSCTSWRSCFRDPIRAYRGRSGINRREPSRIGCCHFSRAGATQWHCLNCEIVLHANREFQPQRFGQKTCRLECALAHGRDTAHKKRLGLSALKRPSERVRLNPLEVDEGGAR